MPMRIAPPLLLNSVLIGPLPSLSLCCLLLLAVSCFLFVWWDGIISSLRTYSVKEMHALVNDLEDHKSYEWEINRIKSGPGVILYLLGTKR